MSVTQDYKIEYENYVQNCRATGVLPTSYADYVKFYLPTQPPPAAVPAPARIQFTAQELALVALLLTAHIRKFERAYSESPVGSPLEAELRLKIELADCALARVRCA
jgi:hypothetical protein